MRTHSVALEIASTRTASGGPIEVDDLASIVGGAGPFGSFDALIAAACAAGLIESVEEGGDRPLAFGPSALPDLDEEAVDAMLADTANLAEVLLGHLDDGVPRGGAVIVLPRPREAPAALAKKRRARR